jgi:8-oxo-dGTP pyrophosphatase MutT (NUDIX family)
MSVVKKPQSAASVILLRPAHPEGFKVFLTRRRDEMPILGGTYCFPGGSVHESDYADGMLRRCRGLSAAAAQKIVGAHLPPRQALGFWVAAVRDLFEEVGVLLAVKETGEPLTWDAKLQVRLLEKSAACRNGSLTFQSFLESENLFCAAAGLAYFSHWQTPATPSSSIDWRLFLMAIPDDQAPLEKWMPTGEPWARVERSTEIAHSLWLAPDRALQLFSRGELPMAFATFASLRTLADFGSVKSVLKEFQPEFT